MSYKYHLHAYTRACAVALSTLCILHACTGGNVDKLSLQQKRKKGVTISETAIPIPLLSDAFASVSLEAGGLLGGMEGGSGQEEQKEVESSAQGTSAGTAVAGAQGDVQRQAALASTYTYTTHYSPEAATRYGFDSVKRIPGDGNCLFRAIADQLEHVLQLSCLAQPHQVLRRIAANHMASHTQLYRTFTAEQTPAAVEKLMREIETNGVWGGQEALSALSRALQVTIVVISDNQAPTVHRPAYSIGTIYLYYKDRLHYDSPQVAAGFKLTEALATIIRNTTIDEAYTPTGLPASTRQATKHLLQSTADALQTEAKPTKSCNKTYLTDLATELQVSPIGKNTREAASIIFDMVRLSYLDELEKLVKNLIEFGGRPAALHKLEIFLSQFPQLSYEVLEELLVLLSLGKAFDADLKSRMVFLARKAMKNMPQEFVKSAQQKLQQYKTVVPDLSSDLDSITVEQHDAKRKAEETSEEHIIASIVNQINAVLANPGPDAQKSLRALMHKNCDYGSRIAEALSTKEKNDTVSAIFALLLAQSNDPYVMRKAIKAEIPPALLAYYQRQKNVSESVAVVGRTVMKAFGRCLKAALPNAQALLQELSESIKNANLPSAVRSDALHSLTEGLVTRQDIPQELHNKLVEQVLQTALTEYQKENSCQWLKSASVAAVARLVKAKLCKPTLLYNIMQSVQEQEDRLRLLGVYTDSILDSTKNIKPILSSIREFTPENMASDRTRRLLTFVWTGLMRKAPEYMEQYIKARAYEPIFQAVSQDWLPAAIDALTDMYEKLPSEHQKQVYEKFLAVAQGKETIGNDWDPEYSPLLAIRALGKLLKVQASEDDKKRSQKIRSTLRQLCQDDKASAAIHLKAAEIILETEQEQGKQTFSLAALGRRLLSILKDHSDALVCYTASARLLELISKELPRTSILSQLLPASSKTREQSIVRHKGVALYFFAKLKKLLERQKNGARKKTKRRSRLS